MSVCRTCLKTPANKDISQLEEVVNEDNKNCIDIMMFCLDITVIPNSNITTNLCYNCYRKIITFYKFKALSLKNDDYLKSLYPAVTLVDQEISVHVDENGIKLENSLDPDEFGPSLFEDSYIYVKEELDVKHEDTEDRESENELQNMEEENTVEEIEDEIKETAPVRKKRKRIAKRKICKECGKSVQSLKRHLPVHQLKGERQMVQCKACPKLFATEDSLKRHHRFKHLGLKRECDICHKKYVDLLTHKMRLHKPHAPLFFCALCDRSFISQSVLDEHMTIHKKIHVHGYECDICHNKFKLKYHIRSHIQQVHEKVKRYHCHVCPSGFYAKNQFENHLRVHSRERPFKCDDCGKFFGSKSGLRTHRFIHGDPETKMVNCQLCDKSFARDSLKVHIRVHTKEKRYPCQYCGARFARSHHRKRHELRCTRGGTRNISPSDCHVAVGADVQCDTKE